MWTAREQCNTMDNAVESVLSMHRESLVLQVEEVHHGRKHRDSVLTYMTVRISTSIIMTVSVAAFVVFKFLGG